MILSLGLPELASRERGAKSAERERRCDMTHGGDDHVLGVDGCKVGWVGVVLPVAENEPVRTVLGATLSELAAQVGSMAAVGIDMPLRLTDTPWPRPSELAAKACLGAKRSTLFITPPLSAYAEADYAAACQVAIRLTGKAFSRQAWALKRKIGELDGWWRSAGCDVWEVHPELSFAAMTGAVIHPPKSTWAGLELRRTALAEAGIVVPADIGEAGRAGPDDVLDAAAAAWTARRIATRTARSFPEGAAGGDAAIWA
jgi:predicted RNase H-like nuclease